MSPSQQIDRLQDQIQIRNRFFRMVIHDLRGPTTSIKMGSELALKEIGKLIDRKMQLQSGLDAKAGRRLTTGFLRRSMEAGR